MHRRKEHQSDINHEAHEALEDAVVTATLHSNAQGVPLDCFCVAGIRATRRG